MTCYSPWIATGDGGAKRPIACGRCHDCRLEYSRQWAIRCVHEASCWPQNVFVTLTYKEDRDSLDYHDFQLFMRYLRRTGRKVRFYMCGEYGDQNGRPHYHALLFNCWFNDMKYWRMSPAGFKLYRSAELERLWAHGHSEIGMVSFESAAYVARYVMKKYTGEKALEVFGDKTVPFARMSLRPGIGSEWFSRYGKSDVLPDGQIVHNGRKGAAPKYYRRKLRQRWPLEYLGVQMVQEELARIPYKNGEMMPERLEAKTIVSNARSNLLKRDL